MILEIYVKTENIDQFRNEIAAVGKITNTIGIIEDFILCVIECKEKDREKIEYSGIKWSLNTEKGRQIYEKKYNRENRKSISG